MVRLLVLSMLVAPAAWAEESPERSEPFVIEAASALKLEVTHAFERSVARERIGYLLAYWAERFGVQNQWLGDRVFLSGRVWGVDFKAVFHVQEKAVLALADDPGSVLTSAAQGYVHRKLRKYLHPTYDDP